MLHDIIFLILGLGLIIAGGNYVTDGSVAVANRFRVSPVIVGLTVVAFGSSTPDLVISLLSTIKGKTELAMGDIVGAGIFDILLVVGITALVRPIHLSKEALRVDIPVMVFAGLMLLLCSFGHFFGHDEPYALNRIEGIIMLLVYGAFLIYTIINARKQKVPEPKSATVTHAAAGGKAQKAAQKPPMALWLAIVCIVGGLAALVIGGNWIVDGASGIAEKAGMSEAMVGLTIVAIGSSVPDISASVMAALKGQAGLAMGNVVGACIMNMLFILGACATVHPLEAGHLTLVDFATMAGSAVLVWALGFFDRKHTLARFAGTLLVLLYICYMAYLVISHA